MSVRERQKFLDDFQEYLTERAGSGISVVEIHFRKKDWQASLTNLLINNPLIKTIAPDVVEKHAGDAWDEFSTIVKQWIDKRKKPAGNITYYAINNKRSHKFEKDRIIIKLRGRRTKSARSMPGRKKGKVSGAPSPAWIDNSINGIKKHLKRNVRKFNMPKVLTAEHGTLPEGEQGVGQARFGMKKVLKTPQRRPGALGNNVSNAAIQALKDAIDRNSAFTDVYAMYVQDFFHSQYQSTVTKRKSSTKFVAEHKATLTMIPGESPENKGILDREDRDIFKTDFTDAKAKALFKERYPMLTDKTINQIFSASKPLIEEFGDYATQGAIKTFLEEAGLRVTATGALDKRYKGITKSGGLDMRLSFNKELVEKMRLKNTVTKSSIQKSRSAKAAKAQRRKIRSATGVTVANSVKQSRRGKGTGPTANTQALALKNIINEVLPETVMAKMQLPRLVNRTGRFKDSAEVVNTFMGPRGGLTIEYTYQKDPYAVFEPGVGRRPWANQYRDPKHIIGQSIREIVAANMRGMQPLIRRV